MTQIVTSLLSRLGHPSGAKANRPDFGCRLHPVEVRVASVHPIQYFAMTGVHITLDIRALAARVLSSIP
jgi:hypothetical protein